MYMSICKPAEESGVYVLHGCRRVWHEDKQPAFKAIYTTFKQVMICRVSDQILFSLLIQSTLFIQSLNSQYNNCLLNIDNLTGMKTLLKRLHLIRNYARTLYLILNPSLAKHDMPCLSKQCRSRSVGF